MHVISNLNIHTHMRSFGTFIFTIGVLLFMNNLGWFDAIQWNIVWPIILIVVGIWIVLRSKRRCACSRLCKVAGICDAECDSCHGPSKTTKNSRIATAKKPSPLL